MASKKKDLKEQAEPPKIPLLKKLISQDATWTKDEYLDGVYWVRQIISAVAGILCGVLQFKGFVVVSMFITTLFALSLIFFRSFHGVDLEDYGGQTEGLFPAIALFILLWVCFYSVFN